MHSLVFVVALASSLGCSITQKKSVLETAFSETDRRHEYFEATLRVLDQNPDYVDEFFAQAKAHPRTLDRFVAATARDLHDTRLAKMTAQHLVANPASLKQVLVQTLMAAKPNAKARRAIAAAIEAKIDIATDLISDRPSAVAASLEATVNAIADKPEARAAFLAAMQRSSPTIARYLAADPETLKVMTRALLREAVQDAAFTVKEILEGI